MTGFPAFLAADYASRPCRCEAVPDLSLDADVEREAAALLADPNPAAAVARALWARNVEIAKLKKKEPRK